MSYRWTGLSASVAIVGWMAVPTLSFAQVDPNIGASLTAADADLNATYRELTTALSPAEREQVRTAERAWLAFMDKNQAAFRALAAKRNMPQTQVVSAALAETQARRDTLRSMLAETSNFSRDQQARQLQQADSELNATYKDCLVSLDGADIALLRDAQRAWITFRDAQARAKNALTTSLQVITRRTVQLRGFYLGAAPETAVHQEAGLSSLETQNSNRVVPDPFERAR